MCRLAPNQRAHRGLTVVELAVTIGLVGLLSTVWLSLTFYGTEAMVFLPKAQLANQVAAELFQAILEGSRSSVSGQQVPGLRFSAGWGGGSEPAIWLAEPTRVGYWANGTQRVVIWLHDNNRINRALASSGECPAPLADQETLGPAESSGLKVLMTESSAPLFRYVDRDGHDIDPPGCAAKEIRRVDVTLVLVEDEEEDAGASPSPLVQGLSSVAIRFPLPGGGI